MSDGKMKKSVIFLSDDFILTENEEKIIRNNGQNEIVIFTYSQKIMKEGDVRAICEELGTSVEFIETEPFDENVEGLILEMNNNFSLIIDVSYASPYHIVQLTPYGYLPGNELSVLKNDEPYKINDSMINYNILDDKDLRIIKTIGSGELSVIDIDKIWVNEDRNNIDNYRLKNNSKTLYRRIQKLVKGNFITEIKDKPNRYYLSNNQKYMLRLTKGIVIREKIL